MTYNTLLNDLIEHSGKMIKEIAQECTEKYGVNLTNLYLSNLKTNPGRIASDDISRAIAKACGAEYEDILVVQAYIDKAPAIIREFMEGMQAMSSTGYDIMELYPGDKSDPMYQAFMNQMLEMKKQPLAEFICQYTGELKEDATKMVSEIAKAQQEPKEPKWMVISPEQMKEIRLVNESDIKKLIER